MFLAQSSCHNIIDLGNSITSIVDDTDKKCVQCGNLNDCIF